MPGREYTHVIQRLCPHWYGPDPNGYIEGVTVEIVKSEKCFLCGHKRTHVRTREEFEAHPSRDFDAGEQLSEPGRTVVEVSNE